MLLCILAKTSVAAPRARPTGSSKHTKNLEDHIEVNSNKGIVFAIYKDHKPWPITINSVDKIRPILLADT